MEQEREPLLRHLSKTASDDKPSHAPVHNDYPPSNTAASAIIASVTVITGIGSFLSGVVVVGTPSIAEDLQLPPALILWPSSIYALTCACTLLLLGSVTDIVGSRAMYLTGGFLQAMFSLACGLSTSGTQLIVFRGLAGVAYSFCMPSAVSLLNHSFPPGQFRNWGFAAMGSGQPIGYGLGMTLGGVFGGMSSAGWRTGFYVVAVVDFAVFIMAIWQLPKDKQVPCRSVILQRLRDEIDWVGIVIVSVALALLSYFLAAITGSTSSIRTPLNISSLAVGIPLLVLFPFWVHRQEKKGRPALIPNSLWRDPVFTGTCLCVFLNWGSFNAFEQMANFVIQDVQGFSSFQAALQFLPSIISGVLVGLLVGRLVTSIRADYIVLVATVFTSVASILMSMLDLQWVYWKCVFVAIFLSPIAADALFTVSNLYITSVFPMTMQALAGGVAQTVSNVGRSLGMAIAQLIANSVTARVESETLVTMAATDGSSPIALMQGYRASFWFCFALNAASLFLIVGLRKIGKVGQKKPAEHAGYSTFGSERNAPDSGEARPTDRLLSRRVDALC